MEKKYIGIQDELLDFLMANRKSSILSRKLGYKFNQVSRWRNHSKKLKWPEFVRICQAVKIPIESVLEDVFGISIQRKSDCNKAFLKILLSQKSNKRSVQAVLTKSRATFYRLEKQKTYPDFALVLALIDLLPGRLKFFIETLKLNQFNLSAKGVKVSPFSVPWFGVVSAAMAQKEHLNGASYSAEWIAKKVNLTVLQVQQAVQAMVENEMIAWDGSHYKPTLPRTLAINHKRSQAEFVNNFKYWAQKSILSIESQNLKDFDTDKFAGVFRTFMATKENVETINSLISEMEEKIHNIVTATAGEKTEIRCFVFSHFDVCSN